MITYNPKDWFTFIFRIHKTETFRQLIPLMLAVAAYSGIVAYVELHNFLTTDVRELTRAISTIYSILGFTLSLLLVFRTNSAYDRWWEARKLWGELTNSSRALSAHFHAILSAEDRIERKILATLLSVFSYSLQAHLKEERLDESYFQQEFDGQSSADYPRRFAAATHQPVEIYRTLMSFVQQLRLSGKLNAQEIYHFKSELNKLIDVCGGCERIKRTPIPFSYSVFIKKFIFFYVMLFPLIYCVQMWYFIVPVTVFVLYVLASLELIAEEIEDPFNGEPNDLPTHEMALNIGKNVHHILTSPTH